MAAQRNLSIGITINLDNFENLRLEVTDEVSGAEGAEELITFLDAILSRLGRGSVETAERVDAYRRRVFSLPMKPEEGEPRATVQVEAAAIRPGPEPTGEVAPHVTAPAEAPEAVVPSEPPGAVSPTGGEALRDVIPPQATAPPREDQITCERCGAPMTPIQRKLSQLFQNKDLCKKCLSQPM